MSTQITHTDKRVERMHRQIVESDDKQREYVPRLCRKIENLFLSWIAWLYRNGEIDEREADRLRGRLSDIRMAYMKGRKN